MAIKLFNKGHRTIDSFKPGTSGAFTPEAAKRLLAMYGDELILLEEEVSEDADFSDEADEPAKTRGRKKAASE